MAPLDCLAWFLAVLGCGGSDDRCDGTRRLRAGTEIVAFPRRRPSRKSPKTKTPPVPVGLTAKKPGSVAEKESGLP
jgi:hypothetical protein